MGEFSLTHILIVLILFLVFFGPKKLPQLGQSLGESIRGFKDAMNGIDKPTQTTQTTHPPKPEQTHQAPTSALHEAPPQVSQETTVKTETEKKS